MEAASAGPYWLRARTVAKENSFFGVQGLHLSRVGNAVFATSLLQHLLAFTFQVNGGRGRARARQARLFRVPREGFSACRQLSPVDIQEP